MIKKLFKRFKASEFAVNVSKLTTGTAIAQLISIATAPFLYRIYEREHYGTLGMYMAITGVLGVFSTLQFLQVIMLEKEDDDAINAMWLNRIINTCFAILVAVSLLVFSPLFAKWADNEALSKWFWMIPIGIFFAGQNEIFRIWANRKKEYNLLTFNGIFMAVLTPIISISLGLYIKNETGLFIGLLVGQSLPALILLIGLAKKYDLGYSQMNIKEVKNLFLQYKRLPIYSLPSEFINRFTSQLPIFMLNAYAGPSEVGVYSLCNRMLSIPISFIGGVISTVYQQKATQDIHEKGNCIQIFNKTFKVLTIVSIAPTLGIMFFGPDIFTFFFGLKWFEAGVYARIFIVMFMLQLIVSPLTYVLFIRRKFKLDFAIHLLIVILLILAYFIGLKFFNTNVALILHSLFYSGVYILSYFISKRLSQEIK